jgi:hypothetical protein
MSPSCPNVAGRLATFALLPGIAPNNNGSWSKARYNPTIQGTTHRQRSTSTTDESPTNTHMRFECTWSAAPRLRLSRSAVPREYSGSVNLTHNRHLSSFRTRRTRASLAVAMLMVVGTTASACALLENLGAFSEAACNGGKCVDGGDGGPSPDGNPDGVHILIDI